MNIEQKWNRSDRQNRFRRNRPVTCGPLVRVLLVFWTYYPWSYIQEDILHKLSKFNRNHFICFTEIRHFGGIFEGPLFLEFECSYSPETGLWFSNTKYEWSLVNRWGAEEAQQPYLQTFTQPDRQNTKHCFFLYSGVWIMYKSIRKMWSIFPPLQHFHIRLTYTRM